MNVESLIKQIEMRPGMYVGNPSIEKIFHFISGFLYNNVVTNREDEVDLAFRNHFHEWVKVNLERRYLVKFDEQRNYLFYINQTFPDEKDRLDVFFGLSNEFFSELNKNR